MRYRRTTMAQPCNMNSLNEEVGLAVMAKMVLGTAQLGSAYGINNTIGALSELEGFEVLEQASRSNISLLDTAEGYGNSEEIIGSYCQAHPGHGFKICTKLTSAIDASDEALVRTKLSAMQDRLKGLPVEIYYLHSFEACLNQDLLTLLAKLRDEGAFNLLGVSIYEPKELDYIIENESDRIDAVQIPLNVFNCAQWLANDILKRAVDAGIVLLARSVYLQGLIFKDPQDPFVKSLGLSEILLSLCMRAENLSVSKTKLALDFVRSVKEVSYVILGSESAQQVSDNASYFDQAIVWDGVSRQEQIEASKLIPAQAIDPRTW